MVSLGDQQGMKNAQGGTQREMDSKESPVEGQDKEDGKKPSNDDPQDEGGFDADSDGMSEDDALSKIPACYCVDASGRKDDMSQGLQMSLGGAKDMYVGGEGDGRKEAEDSGGSKGVIIEGGGLVYSSGITSRGYERETMEGMVLGLAREEVLVSAVDEMAGKVDEAKGRKKSVDEPSEGERQGGSEGVLRLTACSNHSGVKRVKQAKLV
ncbi:hypothetical protein GUJ93_ZPchr0458g22643 [Zizania palustris]|uniref:Uncharacterized protein n=1 Tax=Zizania palustris TaxID=103762 RepID=A0A8J5VE36_ZIZPA|nr:hypothetical protein GUJ93_ZPchr0458g22643 [Zizania palustris]